MSRSQSLAGNQAFNEAISAPISGTAGNQATGQESVAIRSGTSTSLNQSVTGAISGVAGGATVVGAGGTYVQTLDAELADSALDFNTGLARLVVDTSTANTSKLIDALTAQTLQGQSFNAGLVNDFQNLAETSQLLARDTLATALNSDQLAKAPATTANRNADRTTLVALAAAALVGLWLWKRSR